MVRRNNSGQRIRDGSSRNTPEHGSSIPAGKFPDFFRCIPITFLCFPPRTGRKSPENFQVFPMHSDHFPVLSAKNWSEIFRPEYCFHVPVYSCKIQRFFRLFPAGSFGIWSPESSTWEVFILKKRHVGMISYNCSLCIGEIR